MSSKITMLKLTRAMPLYFCDRLPTPVWQTKPGLTGNIF
jgi:hypothetical protein